MMLMPSDIFFLGSHAADWSPALTMSSGKRKHAETQIMSSLAFDNFVLSAVQISQPDKLSLMPVFLTLNQMLGCSLQSLQSLYVSSSTVMGQISAACGTVCVDGLISGQRSLSSSQGGNFVHSIRGLRRDKESLVKEKE